MLADVLKSNNKKDDKSEEDCEMTIVNNSIERSNNDSTNIEENKTQGND